MHSNLKLENIFKKDKIFKISGLENSIYLEKNQKSKIKFGTFPYMSPEQLKNEDCNQKIDIWSIGVIYFLLLTKKFPFIGSKREYILNDIEKKIY